MNEIFDILFVIFAVVIVCLVIALILFTVAVPFVKERKYIKIQIRYADDEEERKFWKKELKLLYIKYIPLIGEVFFK